MPKTVKPVQEPEPPPDPRSSLGIAPAVLAKRNKAKKTWCHVSCSATSAPDIEFDPNCNEENPKTITYKDVIKAAMAIKEIIPRTPLIKSRCCKRFRIDLHHKVEILHPTGSFHERGALHALMSLSAEQRNAGVITASIGNWAMALAYHAYKLEIKLTVVLPVSTLLPVVEKCQEHGAKVVVHGKGLAEAKHHAFTMLQENDIPPLPIYINGYDHPHVIAGSGTVGLEIMEQLPNTDVILVPVGGGGLISGIAAVVKQMKPEVHIYGIESAKNCCFFKAMERELPYNTAVEPGLTTSLAVSTAGYNAFHTAKSFIDKMVLVDDDWVARGIMHLLEEEKLLSEGAGAASLGALFAVPDILPELRGKTVVSIISGGNIDTVIIPRCIERAKASEGRLIKLIVTLPSYHQSVQLKILSMIANVGGNVLHYDAEHNWLEYDDLFTIKLNLIIETKNLEHACTLKRIMEKLFPNLCHFLEDPFSPIPICVCFPKRRAYSR